MPRSVKIPSACPHAYCIMEYEWNGREGSHDRYKELHTMSASNPANSAFAEEQLTEDEAEKALLALAEPLEWQETVNSTKASRLLKRTLIRSGTNLCIGWKSGRLSSAYSVIVYRRGLARWYGAYPGTVPMDSSPHTYPNIDAAKTACDNHHATGKWG